MDVQPERAIEQLLRDQRAVSGDDHRVHLGVAQLRWALGLPHLDPQLVRGFLRRRRAELAPSTSRPVGPGQQVGDVVPLGQPAQYVRTERRRRSDGQPHGVRSCTATHRTVGRSRMLQCKT